MHRKSSIIIVALVAAAAVDYAAPAAHADDHAASVSNAPGSSQKGCEVDNECFIPAAVTVGVGGEVTWTNDDSAAHTVTSGAPAGGPDGVFNSDLLMPDTEFSHTFEEAGEYPYFCAVRPWMTGMVTVSAADDGDSAERGSGSTILGDGT